MKFTEREMTVAIEVVAKRMNAALRPLKRSDVEAAWQSLAPYEKYVRKAAVGEAVLPALLALPERPTVGATPEFTEQEYAAAAEATTQQLLELRSAGAWAKLSARKRSKLVGAHAALTREVVEAMPLRRDPDALLGADDFVVPDSLDGLL